MDSAARRPANHHRCGSVPQIMSLGHEICNLVERANNKIDELHLHDRPQAEIAHAAGRADDGAFADRRVHHALPAEPRQQALAGLERPAVHAHVFAEQDHCRIAFHLLEHRLPDGFEKRDLRTARGSFTRSGPVRFGHSISAPFAKRSPPQPSRSSSLPALSGFLRRVSARRWISPPRLAHRQNESARWLRPNLCRPQIPAPSTPPQRSISVASLPRWAAPTSRGSCGNRRPCSTRLPPPAPAAASANSPRTPVPSRAARQSCPRSLAWTSRREVFRLPNIFHTA